MRSSARRTKMPPPLPPAGTEEGSAEESLRRLIAAILSVRDRYRVLIEEDRLHHARDSDRPRFAGRHLTEVDALIARGQRTGEFNPMWSPAWIRTAAGHLTIAALKLVHDGELAPNHAATMVADTLLSGIKTPS